MEGDLARRFAEQLPLIGHVQISDNPGRHEPGSGEIAWPYLFELIDRSGYDGWVGAEYTPKGETAAGLGWLAAARGWRGPVIRDGVSLATTYPDRNRRTAASRSKR